MKFAYFPSIIIFALVAVILDTLFFFGLDSRQFIFSGDQFFQFSTHEAFTNSFFLRKPNDLGVLNGWQFITQFWDALYYLAVYHIGLAPIPAEKLLFFLVLFLSLSLSFLGFNKIAHRLTISSGSHAVYIVTLWYCFNPYTLELWHGGVYNLGASFTYALAPLIFYYFSEAVFSATVKATILLCALLMCIASFTFWLYAPLVFFLALYAILRIVLQPTMWRLAAKNIFFLLAAYLPLVAFILFGIMHEYFNNAGDVNAGFSPTFGNMQGGIWYQLNMLFSWGIYTVWWPRTLYPFGDYFLSKTYITGIVSLYTLVVVGLIVYFTKGISLTHTNKITGKNIFSRIIFYGTARMRRMKIFMPSSYNTVATTHQAIVLTLVFAVAVFLAKGAQPPYGEIFLFLYDHVPFFNVFRTPDIRFGFPMVLALALLLLLVSQVYSKKIFVFCTLVITLILAWPFFSGAAVKGENVDGKYYDRITHIPDTYSNVANYINQNAGQGSYVLPIPAIEYGHYFVDQNEHLIGQDMVAKITKAPFVYVSSSGGIFKGSHETLKSILENKQYDKFQNFPIRYVLLRKDICPECPVISENDLAQISDLVYHNAVFRLYEMRNYRSIVDSPNISYERVNSLKFRVHFKHVTEPQELTLLQNFNENWKVFLDSDTSRDSCLSNIRNSYSNTVECINGATLLEKDDWKYLWKPSLFESSHQLKWGYANRWIVSPKDIRLNASNSDYSVNPDGSLNFTLTVYYQPAIKHLLSGLISLISVAILLGILTFGMFSRRGPKGSHT